MEGQIEESNTWSEQDEEGMSTEEQELLQEILRALDGAPAPGGGADGNMISYDDSRWQQHRTELNPAATPLFNVPLGEAAADIGALATERESGAARSPTRNSSPAGGGTKRKRGGPQQMSNLITERLPAITAFLEKNPELATRGLAELVAPELSGGLEFPRFVRSLREATEVSVLRGQAQEPDALASTSTPGRLPQQRGADVGRIQAVYDQALGLSPDERFTLVHWLLDSLRGAAG